MLGIKEMDGVKPLKTRMRQVDSGVCVIRVNFFTAFIARALRSDLANAIKNVHFSCATFCMISKHVMNERHEIIIHDPPAHFLMCHNFLGLAGVLMGHLRSFPRCSESPPKDSRNRQNFTQSISS